MEHQELDDISDETLIASGENHEDVHSVDQLWSLSLTAVDFAIKWALCNSIYRVLPWHSVSTSRLLNIACYLLTVGPAVARLNF
jgi:hypothetical protein